MKKKMRFAPIALALALPLMATALTACPIRTEHKIETTHKIEAHIVIDLRQVQAEAAAVEDEVREPTPTVKPDGEPSAMVMGNNQPTRLAALAKNFLRIFDVSTTAYAADKTEKEALASRKARSKEVNAALDAGCVGENANGNLAARKCKEPAKKHAALIKDENADRKIFYEAIAVRGGHTAKEAKSYGVAYSAEIRKRLKKGQWFQTPHNGQYYDEFTKTDLYKKTGKPGKDKWVQAP